MTTTPADTTLDNALNPQQKKRWEKLSKKYGSREPKHLQDAHDLIAFRNWTWRGNDFIASPDTAYQQVVRDTTDVRPGTCDCDDFMANEALCSHRMVAWVTGPPEETVQPENGSRPEETAQPDDSRRTGGGATPTTPDDDPGRQDVFQFLNNAKRLSKEARIDTRTDNSGNVYPYLSWQTARDVLTRAAHGRWSKDVPSYQLTKEMAVITIRVTVHLKGIDLHQEAVATQPMETLYARGPKKGQPIPNVAENALKKAERSAFKRALTGWGIDVPEHVRLHYKS